MDKPLNQGSSRTLLGIALAVLGGAELGQLVVQTGGWRWMPAFWPPFGLLLGALLVTEPRRWIRLVTVACIAMAMSDAIHGRGLPAAAIAAAIRGGEACAAAWLVRRIIRAPMALDRLPHSLALILAVLVVPLAGALLAASVPPLAGTASRASMWRAWYLADALGAITATPLAVVLLTASPAAILAHLRGWKALEIAVVLVGAVLVLDGVFAGRLDPSLRVPAFVLPFILWPALRFGPGASATAVFILSFIALWYSGDGQGPAAVLGVSRALLRAQAAVGLTSASLLLLATVVAERKRVAHERNELVGELQRALAEIKTLQGLIPICAWCHKIRNDAGFWQQLEQYLKERTDATFSHGICPDCVEEQTRQLAADDALRSDLAGRR